MDTSTKFFAELTRPNAAPFVERDFFKDAFFTKFANEAMQMAAKSEGWQVPDLKTPQQLGLKDMQMPDLQNGLKEAKPNMMTQAMGNTQKPVQQKPNNPTGVSNSQGFNPV